MKKITLYITSALFVFGVFFNAELLAQSDPSEQILQESRKKFESLTDFSATYSYELKNAAMKSDRVAKGGDFRYKDGMYYLDMGNQAIYCDLESQWIHLKADEEVTIVEYDPEEAVNIESVYKVYESNAKSQYMGEEMLGNSKAHKILMTSLDSELEYNRVTLWINSKTKLLEKASLVDRNQTEEVIVFKNLQTNQGFSLTDFQFNTTKHPNVDIYDER
ncbi:MAG: outer membrane lipoprotein carrier protein LolA [Bacteroidota bacterium]